MSYLSHCKRLSLSRSPVRQKPDAFFGVEVAVHTDCVFVDGRIAAGAQPVDIEKIVGDVTVLLATGAGGIRSQGRFA